MTKYAVVLLALLLLPTPDVWAQPALLPTAGPEGGNATQFVDDPVVAGVVYAKSASGNVYRSTDSGETWRLIDSLIQIHDLVKGVNAVYAGGGDGQVQNT